MGHLLEKQRSAIQSLLREYAQIPYAHDQLRDELIFDREDDHYLLLTTGWQDGNYVHETILHLTIIDNRIYIQCNNTDQDIVQELRGRGVMKNDIIVSELQAQTPVLIPA